MKHIILYTIIILCSFKGYSQDNFRKNYFKISEFKEGKTYEFIDVKNKDNTHRWKMYYKIESSDTIFYTDGLDDKNRVVEVFIEKLQLDGTKMIGYHTIKFDSIGGSQKVNYDIMSNNVFKYNQEKYPLEWSVLSSGQYGREKLTKKRVVVSKNETQNIYNKTYDCLVFKDEFTVEYLDIKQVYNFYQLSYYAKDFGLVRYNRFMPNGKELDYRLFKIIKN
jgi:hypothetical protein